MGARAPVRSSAGRPEPSGGSRGVGSPMVCRVLLEPGRGGGYPPAGASVPAPQRGPRLRASPVDLFGASRAKGYPPAMPRSRTAVGLAIGLAVGAGVLAARFLGWLVPLDLAAYDRLLAALPASAGPPPVALVWIREQEIAAYGHPLPDDLLARAVEELGRLGARAIGVEQGARTARVRIGILTGPAIVGSLGSAERLKYATVGDTLNAAARLESFDKAAFDAEAESSRILLGEETQRRLGGRFRTLALGRHRLRGRGEPLEIHRVLGRA